MIGHRWLGRRLTETWLTPIRHRRFRTDEVARSTGRNSIFLQPSSTTCNTVPVLLGTMKLMETKQRSVGYFRVIEHASRRPTETHTGLVEAVFDTGVQYGCTVEEAIRLVNKKDLETLNEMVANRFSEFRKDYDFVVVEGYNIANFSEELNNEINMNCANAIGASVVLVSDGRDNSSIAKSDDWRTKFRLLSERLLVLRQQNPDILGVILNRYPNAAPDFDLEKATVEKATKVPILGSIPLDGYLRSIMFRDILEGLGANLVFGEGKAMDVPLLLEDLRIVSERIDTMIDRVENNPLVAIGRSRAELKKLITEQISKEPDHRLPNDRVAEVVRLLHPTFSEDMIIAMVDQIDADRDGFVIESDLEGTPPKFLLITAKDRVDIVLTITSLSATRKYGGVLGGVILSGKSSSEITERTLEAISDTPALKALVKVPILETDLEPLELVDRLEQLPTKVTANSGKVERSIKLFNENVNTGKLLSGVQNPLEHISVKMFLHQVSSLARQKEAHIVVPEVNDDRILLAADEVRRRQLARLTLLGDVDAINLRIGSLGLQSRDVEIVDPHKSHKFDEYAEIFDKSLYRETTPEEIAGEALLDPYWYGAMMVKNGDADGFVGGINRPTRGTILSSRKLMLKPGRDLTSVFFMCLDKEVLIYADCALNANPDSTLLSEIAVRASDVAEQVGLRPRVAMLSYATGDSNKGPEIEKVTAAAKLARKKRPKVPIFGPTQYDAAVNPSVARTKVKGENYGVAGRANVLIFPDLNTGNNTYKAVQQSTKATAIGPLVLGMDHLVADLPRGATIQDVVNTIAITSALADK